MSKIDSFIDKVCKAFFFIICYALVLIYLGVYIFPTIDMNITTVLYNITFVKSLYYPLTFSLFLGYFAFRYFKQKAFPKGVKIAFSRDNKYLKLIALKNTSIGISLIVPLFYFLIFNYYLVVNIGLYYLNVENYFSIVSLKYHITRDVFTSAVNNTIATFVIILIAYAIHNVLKALKYNHMVSRINADINKYIYDSTVIDKPSDIRDDFSQMKKLDKKLNNAKYSPKKYFHKKKIYLALSTETKKPIYIDKFMIDEKRHPHISVVGATGSGKGAVTQYIFAQTANMGYCNIAFLPQVDEFLLKQMKISARENNKKLHVIDLKKIDVPQFDLLQNCTSDKFDTLTDYLFPYLEMTTEGKNYYAKFSRKVRDAMSLLAPKADCLIHLVELFNKKYDVNRFLNSDGEVPQFLEEFCNLADMAVCKTNDGIDFRRLIENGDMLYVICPDMTFDNYKSMLCKALFNRLIQIISERSESNHQRIFWFLDEFPEFVNRPMQKAIEQVRKKGCIFIFNMTSFASLDTTKKDVKSYAFIKSTIVNSSLLVYGTPDIALAREISDLTGKIPVYKQGMRGSVNDASSAAFDDGSRNFFGDKENLISEGIIAGMPQYFCVFITRGEVAQIAYTGYMKLPYDVALVNIQPSSLYATDFKIEFSDHCDSEMNNQTDQQNKQKSDKCLKNKKDAVNPTKDSLVGSISEVKDEIALERERLQRSRQKSPTVSNKTEELRESQPIKDSNKTNTTKKVNLINLPKRQDKPEE